MIRRCVALATLVLAGVSPLGAQDIVQQARLQGVAIPPELQQILDQNPDTFEFERAWIQKVQRIRQLRLALESLEGVALSQAQLLSAGAAAIGELSVPTIGALYSGQVALYTSAQYEARLFGDPMDGTYTARNFYREMSRGVFELGGVVPTWPNLPFDAAYYRPSPETNPQFGRVGEFLTHSLDLADPGVDFGLYDNDGLDGIPNSGDDDGFVDVVAFLYQDAPMSCGGPGIWPHRWAYPYATGTGQGYVTNDVSANGGFIQVWDYMIQAGVGCDGASLMEIGTYSHEMGHALALPDLYDTNGGSQGIGEWGLMGSGNWNIQSSPAHMSAWSKDYLGWLNIEAITAAQQGVVLEPVYDNGRVLRYDIPTTPEYFLLEHRSATGSDAFINGEGLLVWHIDPTRGSNQVEERKLVDLEEADGSDHLDLNVNRGDSGDPYPGSSGASTFGPASYPNSYSYDGVFAGFGLDNIQRVGGQLSFDIALTADPFLAAETPTLTAEVGGTAVDTIAVTAHDGSDVGVKATWSQPWLSVSPDTARTPADLIVTADGASLSQGLHVDTIVVASDSAANSPVRVPVTFQITTNLLALGDTLVERISTVDEVDTFYVSLSAGQVVDFAVFPGGEDPLDSPEAQLVRPDGGVQEWFGYDRLLPDPCCRYAALKGGFVVPVSGTWALAVQGGGNVGDYVVKAREAGPILNAEPQRQLHIEGPAGSGVVQDTIWIWNSGPTSADWTGVSTSADIVMSPTSGTLPGLNLPTVSRPADEVVVGPPGVEWAGPGMGMVTEAALAPAGATPVFLNVDLSGTSPGSTYYGTVLNFWLSDSWGGRVTPRVEIWAYDPSVTIVADTLWYGVADLALQPDGQVVLVERYDLHTLDPMTGQLSLWAEGVTGASWGVWGLDLDPDASALLADRYDGTLKRVSPSGTVDSLWIPGDEVYDATVTPDGTIYAVAWSQGLVRVNGDGTTTPISSQGTCCHYAVTYSPTNGGSILFSRASTLYRYAIVTGDVTTVGLLSGGYIYDMEVARSGNLYVRHSDGIWVYSPAGMQLSRLIAPNYGYGVALGEGEVFGSTYGCRDDWCGPYAQVFKAPVDDGPLTADPFLLVETPSLASDPGGTAIDTISVTTDEGTPVGVKVNWTQPWLSVTPDTADTPFDIIVTADGTSLPEGTYADTLVLTSDAAQNSPVRVPVTFQITSDLLALGDTLVGRIDVAGEVDTFFVNLSAGQTVDFAVFPIGGDPVGYPRVQLQRPDATTEDWFGGERRWTLGSCCRYVALKGGFQVPVGGTWTLLVSDGWSESGDYVVKAREAGPILNAEPLWSGPDIVAVAGAGVVQDTVWIWNSGLTSVDWTGSSASVDIVMSPTSGTLAGLGLPSTSLAADSALGPPGSEPDEPMLGIATDARLAPPGATPVLLEVDLSGVTPANIYYGDVLSFSLTDRWGGDVVTPVEVWAYDPSVTVVADTLGYGLGDLAVRPDGQVVLVEERNLQTMDPNTGQLSPWAAGVSPSSSGIRGLALESDGSALLADQYDGTIKRVSPGGTVTTLWNAGESVYDVTVTPDGTIYAVAYSQGLVRVNGDGTATPLSSQGTCCHYSVTYSPANGGSILFARSSTLYQYAISTGDVTTVGSLSGSIYDMEVARSGNLYVRHYSGIWEYSADRVEHRRIIGPNYGFGVTLGEGEVFASVYGCRDDRCGPYAQVFKAPVDDGPLTGDPFLIVGTPALVAEAGGMAVDTVEVTTDGTPVGVKATWNQPWLSVSPDTADTPFDMIVTADGTSLPAGTHWDTLVFTSGAAQNSPVRIPVTFQVTANLLALGDTLVGRIDGVGEVDTFFVNLSAGQTVDFAVFPLGGDPLSYPEVELLRPDGTVEDWFGYERWLPDPCCRYAALKGGFQVPVSGTWALLVDGAGSTGDYVIKARAAGPIVNVEPRLNDTGGPAGSGVVQDTIWIWNSGPTSADWTGSSASADIVMSPTGGTLAGLGLPSASPPHDSTSGPPGRGPEEPMLEVATEAGQAPAGATPVFLEVDLSGFTPDRIFYDRVLSFSLTDLWGGASLTDVDVWAYDPSVTVVADGLLYGLQDLAVRPDGQLVLVEDRNLQTMDPSTGQRSLWAAGVSPTSWGIRGLALEADGSALLADRYEGTVKRVSPGGTVTVLWSAGESVYDVTVTPDGTIYAVGYAQGLVRVNGDGTATPLSSQGACCHNAVTYSPDGGGSILFANRNTLYRYVIGTGEVSTVAGLYDWIYDLEVARSGNLYVRHYVGIWEYSPDGGELSRIIGPNGGYGIALAEGEVFASVYGCWDSSCGGYAQVFKAPIDDGPLTGDPFLVVETPNLMANLVETGATDTIEVSTHDGTPVGVKATWSQPWLSVAPDTADTPFDMIVTADGSSLGAGTHFDTLVFTSDAVQNSPKRVPVTLTLPMSVGDSLLGRIDGGEADTAYVGLSAGQTVDLGVFPFGTDPTRYVFVDLLRPDGTLEETFYRNRLWAGVPCCTHYVALKGGFSVPVSGTWTLVVRGIQGDYLIRTREAGPLLGAEPLFGEDMEGAAGSGVIRDTLWIWNSGPTSADWTGSSASPDVVMSPTSGTLAGLGIPSTSPPAEAESSAVSEVPEAPLLGVAYESQLAPAGATPIFLDVDVSSVSPTHTYYAAVLSFSLLDPWDDDIATDVGVDLWAHDPSLTIVADGLQYGVMGLARRPDGQVALVEDGDLKTMDPATGQLTLLVPGAAQNPILGIDFESDGSVLLADYFDRQVQRVHPDGTKTTLWTAAEAVYDVTVTPGGTVYAVASSQGLVRINGDGTVTSISSQGTCCHYAAAYSSAEGGAILFGHLDTLFKYLISTGEVTMVASLYDRIFDLEVAESGNVYARHTEGIWEYSPDGVEQRRIIGPNYGYGLALGDGEVFGSVYGCREECGPDAQVFKAPISDGPWVPTGTFGDPSGDDAITSLDALVCLSHVVGKDVSQFDATLCDVAPDGPDNTFTGQVTSLDALAILSYVVGKALPEYFRVGELR